jgi:hypothetical protein
MGGFELIFFSDEFFAARVRADISNRRFLGWLFFTLTCFTGAAHCFVIYKHWFVFRDSWPIFVVEVVLAVAGMLFFSQMRQWQDFLKRNCKAPSKPQGGLEIMSTGKAIGLGVLFLLAIFAIAWAVQGNEFFMYKVFAPAQEQVRHDVFKKSQAYTDGMVRDLRRYKMEYDKADPGHKAALKQIIITESDKVDAQYLPSDLIIFIDRLKNETTAPAMSFK